MCKLQIKIEEEIPPNELKYHYLFCQHIFNNRNLSFIEEIKLVWQSLLNKTKNKLNNSYIDNRVNLMKMMMTKNAEIENICLH